MHTPETSPHTEAGERFSEVRIAALIEQLIDIGQIATGKQFCITKLDGGNIESEIARSLEYAVFDEYYGNEYAEMEREYRGYDPTSIFVTAIDTYHMRPAGNIRLLKNEGLGLKTVNDVGQYWEKDMWPLIASDLAEKSIPETYKTIDPTRTLDVATLGIAAEYRHGSHALLLSNALYRAIFNFTLNDGYRDMVAIVQKHVLRRSNTDLNNMFTTIKGLEEMNYLGAQSLPVYANIALGYETAQADNPDFYKFLTGGESRLGINDRIITMPLLNKIDF